VGKRRDITLTTAIILHAVAIRRTTSSKTLMLRMWRNAYTETREHFIEQAKHFLEMQKRL
jgi:hypothetical protein